MSRFRSKRFIDVLTGILFIVVAALIIWVAIPLGVQEPKRVKFVALSPSYYPRLVTYCLLAVGLLLFIRSVLFSKASTSESATAASSSSESKPVARSRTYMLLPVATVLFALYWFLEQLGFVLAPALAIVALLLLAGERSVPAIVLIASMLPLGLYLFFTQVANIPIPGGVLDPILLKLQLS
jgi:putative tricarboxylic transport membrane protein